VFKEQEATGSVTLRQSQLFPPSLPPMIVENEEGVIETPRNPPSGTKNEVYNNNSKDNLNEAGWPALTDGASLHREQKFL